MNFGDALQRRSAQLYKIGADVDSLFREAAEESTKQAIRAAAEKTPPVGDDLSGANTRSGELKAHWATDSVTAPTVKGGSVSGKDYETSLANNMQYASYVDQGHRMDKHFVPGLTLDPVTEKLERGDPSDGGIMVGVKTQYVPGIFMTEAGKDAYEKAALSGLSQKIQELMK